MHPHILITDAGLEERSSPDFYRPYSNQDGQIFSPTLLLPHPDFQTFLRPYEGGGDPKSDSHEWTPHTISLFSPFRATFLALSRVIESDQAGKTKAKHEGMDVGRSENLGGGHDLFLLAMIGLSHKRSAKI